MALVESGWETFLENATDEMRPLLTNHPPSFLDDKDVPALQAADLLAGWVRTMNEAELLGLPKALMIWKDIWPTCLTCGIKPIQI